MAISACPGPGYPGEESYPVVLLPVRGRFSRARLLGMGDCWPHSRLCACRGAGYFRSLARLQPPAKGSTGPGRRAFVRGPGNVPCPVGDERPAVHARAREPARRGMQADRPGSSSCRPGCGEALHDDVLGAAGGAGRAVGARRTWRWLAAQLLWGRLGRYCAGWAWLVYRNRREPEALVRAVFLTLAWGWLLSGAESRGTLLWCLPFMVFARRPQLVLAAGPGSVVLRSLLARDDTRRMAHGTFSITHGLAGIRAVLSGAVAGELVEPRRIRRRAGSDSPQLSPWSGPDLPRTG